MEDTLIAGAGPIGLACAVSAKRRGVDPLVIDAGPVVNSVVRYPVGMTFFTTPEKMEIGGHPFACAGQKATREEALKYYRGVARNEGLRVRPYVRLASARRDNGAIHCTLASHTSEEQVITRRLVLATGYFDHPNLLGIPGEGLPHVSHYFDEPHRGFNLDVVVIGGRNSAVEAALELYRAGARVTLVYRGKDLPGSIKYWVRPDIENRIKAGEIGARLGAEVERITNEAVVIRQGRKEETLPAQRVYALTGYHPDFELFQGMGIALDPKTLRATVNPDTRETNVPGIYMVGSISAGRAISEIFIENGRFDGEKVFA